MDKIQELFEQVHLGGNKQRAYKNSTTGDYVSPCVQDAYSGWRSALEYTEARAYPKQDNPPSTPASTWRANGEPDPHGTRYDGERAKLCLGKMTDDELANAAYLNYDTRPSIQDLLDGNGFMPIVYMTAVKERIRWLSRALLARTKLRSMGDSPVKNWYFNCEGHYVDVNLDDDGKYSIFFKDRNTEDEAWLDQADLPSDPSTPVNPA
jgi:hypothetical protein